MDNVLKYECMSEYESSDSEQNVIKKPIINLHPATITTVSDVIIDISKTQPISEDINSPKMNPVIINRRSLLLLRR